MQSQHIPNTLTYLLGLVGLYYYAGESLRLEVVRHFNEGVVLDGLTHLKLTPAAERPLITHDLIEAFVKAWPKGMLTGRPATLQSWFE